MYKYIDENHVVRAKNPLYIGDKVISNPTEETLRKLGYKEMVEAAPLPECAEGECLIPHYTDGDVIVCTFTVEVIPDGFA